MPCGPLKDNGWLSADYTALYPRRWTFYGHRCKNLKSCKKCNCLCAQRNERIWGSGCIYPRILRLGTNLRWVVSFSFRQLYRQEEYFGTHWIGSWVGPRACLETIKAKITCRCLDSNPDFLGCPVCNLVARMTGFLYFLNCNIYFFSLCLLERTRPNFLNIFIKWKPQECILNVV
jgi:hypothetical protein